MARLQHLSNSVSGPAKQALKGVTLSSTNFKVAWEKLLRRYDSDKRRLRVHLEALINLPQVGSESAEELSRLVDRTEEAVKGLNSLGCPIEHYNNWFVYLVVKKLDRNTRRDWTIHEERVEGFSTYENLLSFLENRINSLADPSDDEFKPTVKASKPPLPQSAQINARGKKATLQSLDSHHAQINQPKGRKKPLKCLFCSGEHTIYRCVEFIKLTAADRFKYIQSKTRCINWLSDKYTRNCLNPNVCSFDGCGEKHNSPLHSCRNAVRVHTAQQQVDVSDSKKKLSRKMTQRIHQDLIVPFQKSLFCWQQLELYCEINLAIVCLLTLSLIQVLCGRLFRDA